MKKIYQYTMILLAGVLGACSSMSVSDPYSENLPAGFDVNVYMALHPELRTAQIRDYIATKNTMFKDSVTKAGGDYNALKVADDAAFNADPAQIVAICVQAKIAEAVCATASTDAALLKDMLAFNIVSTTADLAAVQNIPVDEVAISQQYVVFGQSHGWAYRFCVGAESQGPIRPAASAARAESTDEFVAVSGTYCRGEDGNDHLIQ